MSAPLASRMVGRGSNSPAWPSCCASATAECGGLILSSAATSRGPRKSRATAGGSGGRLVSLTDTDGTTGVREAIRTLHPGYFALVMATGIVSIGMKNHGVYPLSVALLWLGFGAFAVLIVVTAVRVIGFRADVIADLSDPRRAFGSF